MYRHFHTWILLECIFGYCPAVKYFQDDDTYPTNHTTTFHDIPSDCDLFGSQFIEENSTGNITLNYTSGVYWVGAKITFSRNINPIGTTSECNKKEPYGISLDDCNSRCQSSIYIVHNFRSRVCQCLDSTEKVKTSLASAYPCETDSNGLCLPSGCMVYKRGLTNAASEFLCGYIRYYDPPGIFAYETAQCSSSLQFICSQDLNIERNATTWHEAHQHCINSNDGARLIRKESDIVDKKPFEDGQKYWVAYFRRQVNILGKGDKDETVCVAANITDGKLELISRFCSDKYRAICLSSGIVKANQDQTSDTFPTKILAVAGGIVFIVLISVAVICKIKKRNTRIVEDYPHSETETNKETKEQEITDLLSAKPSTENISKSLSLSPTYSDPLNSLPPNVQPPPPQEVEYAVVANPKTKKQGTSKTNKNVVENENPYQTPYA